MQHALERILLRLREYVQLARCPIPPFKPMMLTVLINNQHPWLAFCLVLLHDVWDRVLAFAIEGDVDLAALVIYGSDHCERQCQTRDYWEGKNESVQVFSDILDRCPLNRNHGPAAEMWSVVLYAVQNVSLAVRRDEVPG